MQWEYDAAVNTNNQANHSEMVYSKIYIKQLKVQQLYDILEIIIQLLKVLHTIQRFTLGAIFMINGLY